MISPACDKLPKKASDEQGESRTGFKNTLIQYLESYQLECLIEWIQLVKRCNFEAVRFNSHTKTDGTIKYVKF